MTTFQCNKAMIDWNKTEDRIFKWSQAAIKKFARAFPDELICSVFFDSEPRYGYVFLAFDTLDNSIKSAKQLEQFALEGRQRYMKFDEAWRNARYGINTPAISLLNTNSGDFAFQEYAEIQFPAWQRLVESKNYQQKYPKRNEGDDDYLDGNVRIVLWKVVERLVAADAFCQLRRAHPFFVGYAFHDEEEVILRVLNWPDDVPQRMKDAGKQFEKEWIASLKKNPPKASEVEDWLETQVWSDA